MTLFDDPARQSKQERARTVTLKARKARREEAELHGPRDSLHRDGLGEVARLVDVGAALDGDVVGEELEGQDG